MTESGPRTVFLVMCEARVYVDVWVGEVVEDS